MASIETRLERLESMEAARSVLARYAEACDAQDLGAIGDLFCDDAELQIPGSLFRGGDEVLGFFDRAWRADPTTKSHFITNVTAGGYAPGRIDTTSYFFYTALGRPAVVLGWGEYHDVVDTDGERPRLARKSISMRHPTGSEE